MILASLQKKIRKEINQSSVFLLIELNADPEATVKILSLQSCSCM